VDSLVVRGVSLNRIVHNLYWVILVFVQDSLLWRDINNHFALVCFP
jgi:hypothetical protein